MKRKLAVIAAGWFLFTATLTANDDTETLRAALRTANAADDGVALLRTAKALRARFPGHPTYSYLAARGHALQSDSAAALQSLEELTSRNVDMLANVDRDPAFAMLVGQPAYAKLVRKVQPLREPVGVAFRQWQFSDSETLPESIVVASDGRVYLGSVRQREVLVRESDGNIGRWSSPVLWSVQGMHLSPDEKQLWVATSAMNVTAGIPAEEHGRTALAAFDTGTGEMVIHHELDLPGEHVLGDFLFVDADTLLSTDSIGGGVYSLDIRKGDFRQRVAPGILRSPQGLAQIGRYIFIADYGNGLYRLDLANDELKKVEDGPASPYGIDGLYAHDGALVAIQNGVRPQQVSRFRISGDGTRITRHELLLANHADFDEPTLGTIVNNTFYLVANSHWNHVDAEGNFVADELSSPVILSMTLPRITENENRAQNSRGRD